MNNETSRQPKPHKRTWRDPRLSFGGFLVLSCILAAMLVGVAQFLYINSSEYRLDLTRPGFDDVDKEDIVEVDRSEGFDTTSPVTKKSLKEEISSLQTRQQDLGRHGDFSGAEIDDIRNQLLQ